MKRLLSGIQPTGIMHIGNYLGAVKIWTELQHEYESLIFIADLHAITIPQDAKELKRSVLMTAASLIACGIDTSKTILFHQSAVPEHAELGWMLSCMTSIGWLNKMTQFKDKAGKNKELASLGLYSYPVLQAADILIYKADIVPVGEDQKQHLELTRDIAQSFNRTTKSDYFKLPDPHILKTGARIMSLRDGLKKMSKSDESDASRINLTDSADLIRQKIKKSKTDSELSISYDKERRPEVSNLLELFSCFSGRSINDIEQEFIGKTSSSFKEALSDVIIDKIEPITIKINQLIKDEIHLTSILNNGADRAKILANQHIKEIKELIGFLK